MKHTHQIVLLHSNGEAVLGTRRFDRLFAFESHIWFREFCKRHFSAMAKVKDSTLAGYHYRNSDGTVVAELR